MDPIDDIEQIVLPPLHHAARRDDLEEVKRLLRQPGVNVNQVADRLTALTVATIHNHIEVVKELVQAGADPNLPRHFPPLHIAANFNSLEVMEILIAAGADVNAIMPHLCLHISAMTVTLTKDPLSVEAARTPIAAGADVNAGSAFFPLDVAVEISRFDAVKMLLKAGANPCRRDDGRRLLWKAVQGAHRVQQRKPNSPKSYSKWDMVAALAAAGNRCWDELPAPCPRLECALPAVGATSPQDLPQIFRRLKPGAKAKIRCTLMLLHRHVPEKRLRGKILTATLADAREAVPLESWLPDSILDRILELDA